MDELISLLLDRRLVGVNEVTIRDKLFVQTGTADIQAAVLAKKKTASELLSIYPYILFFKVSKLNCSELKRRRTLRNDNYT